MDEENLDTVVTVAIHQNASTLSGHGLWSGIQSFPLPSPRQFGDTRAAQLGR